MKEKEEEEGEEEEEEEEEENAILAFWYAGVTVGELDVKSLVEHDNIMVKVRSHRVIQIDCMSCQLLYRWMSAVSNNIQTPLFMKSTQSYVQWVPLVVG